MANGSQAVATALSPWGRLAVGTDAILASPTPRGERHRSGGLEYPQGHLDCWPKAGSATGHRPTNTRRRRWKGRPLPARHFVSVPDTAWIGQGTAFGTPKAQRRCTLLVVWYAERKNPGSSSPTLPPTRWELVAASGSNWPRLSLGWKWDKTRRTEPTWWCCRWPPCWPGLRHQGGRRPGPPDCPRQVAGAAQSTGSQSSGPSDPSGAHRQDPPRHRLAQAIADQGSPLEPRLAAARTLASAQAQLGDYPPCPCVKNRLHTPLRGG